MSLKVHTHLGVLRVWPSRTILMLGSQPSKNISPLAYSFLGCPTHPQKVSDARWLPNPPILLKTRMLCLHFHSWSSSRLTFFSPGLVHDTWIREPYLSLLLNRESPLYPDSLLILGRSLLFMLPPGDQFLLFIHWIIFRGFQPFHQSCHHPHHAYHINEHLHHIEDCVPTLLR